MLNEKWDRRFLKLAEEIASWSKDRSTQVGSVLVNDDRKILSVGYNGLPQDLDNEEEILSNRDLKLAIGLHAEENVFLTYEGSTKDCTIYTWPFPPCAKCSSIIIQKKIKRIVTIDSFPERWKENMLLGYNNTCKVGISTTYY